MKLDEFAFFNQQLATMLRDGIPLEGALRRLCSEMRRSTLRDELRALEADLARGTPMAEALGSRQLPELYKRMILVGVKANDLPGALTMLADYFQRQNNLWTRMKGLMVYPVIVLFAAFLLSLFLSFILKEFIWTNLTALAGTASLPPLVQVLWVTPAVLGLLLVAVLVIALVGRLRRALRWRLPAFREASIARVASALSLMLRNGVPLDDSLAFVQQLEKGTVAEGEINRWRTKLAAGRGKFSEMTEGGKHFPALFTWTVAQSGENIAGGFERAAELYQARAKYRSELLLYSLLPCSILLLASMLVAQMQPVIVAMTSLLRALSAD
jgi:type II secretory pathway component PulF